MGGSGQRMGGSGQRVKKWAKSAFCGQRCNFVGQRNFINRVIPRRDRSARRQCFRLLVGLFFVLRVTESCTIVWQSMNITNTCHVVLLFYQCFPIVCTLLRHIVMILSLMFADAIRFPDILTPYLPPGQTQNVTSQAIMSSPNLTPKVSWV